jgi:hypothetical protein
MVIIMSMGERLYTGNGSEIMTHSILRKESIPRCNGREGSPTRHLSPGRYGGSLKGQRRSFQSSSSNVSNSPIYSPVKLRSTSFSSPRLSRSSPNLPSSSPPHTPQRHLTKPPNKRLEQALDKFSKVALPFYLQIISCHTSNISQVRNF